MGCPQPEEIPEDQFDESALPICVIQRILTGQRQEEEKEDWLRTKIFHTRVEYGD